MKNSIISAVAALYIAGTTITSCDSPKEKVEKATENVTEANKSLSEAKQAYLSDVEIYRTATNERIASNDKILADLKASLRYNKAQAKADYNVTIAGLEKKKMDEYKADEQDKWEAFKTEFDHDMDGLSDAFRDLTVNNTK